MLVSKDCILYTPVPLTQQAKDWFKANNPPKPVKMFLLEVKRNNFVMKRRCPNES